MLLWRTSSGTAPWTNQHASNNVLFCGTIKIFKKHYQTIQSWMFFYPIQILLESECDCTDTHVKIKIHVFSLVCLFIMVIMHGTENVFQKAWCLTVYFFFQKNDLLTSSVDIPIWLHAFWLNVNHQMKTLFSLFCIEPEISWQYYTVICLVLGLWCKCYVKIKILMLFFSFFCICTPVGGNVTLSTN